MTPAQLAALEPLLRERLDLASGRMLEFIERTTVTQLDATQRAELRDLLAWEIGMATACGLQAALVR